MSRNMDMSNYVETKKPSPQGEALILHLNLMSRNIKMSNVVESKEYYNHNMFLL